MEVGQDEEPAMRSMILSLVRRVEAIPATNGELAGLFAATVILRNLLESLASGLLFPIPAFLFHFPMAYVFPMLGLTGLMHMFSGYPLRRLLKLMVFAWTLTLLPPLLDFLLGTSSAIGYFPLEKSNASFFLINFFNPAVELPGTTAGIRIEAAIGCILAGVFTWAVASDRKLLRGLGTTAVFAPVFLMFFTWPSLVYVLTVDLFPYASSLQEYYQWHAATSPHLTGSLHYAVFLVDAVPLTLILAWFYRKLDAGGFREFASSMVRRIWTLAPALAGTAYFLMASGGILTFADTVSMTGALLAALLIVMSRFARGRVRVIMWSMALLCAISVGWPTAALGLLSISLLMLPLPRPVPSGLSSASIFLVSSSPAGLSWGPAAILACLFCALTASRRRWLGPSAAAASLAAAVLFSPVATTSYTQYYRWLFDGISRNGRLEFTLPVARELAASGGDMLNLAKVELEEGDLNRSRWSYETAVRRGEDSPDTHRLGLNLALAQDRDEEFGLILNRVTADPDLLERIDLGRILVARAARDSDTLFIRRALEIKGPIPQLYHAYSTALASSGELQRASAYARAAVSHPEAQAGQYAWAIHVTALSGGDYDSLFTLGIRRFPGSVDIMESRVMAPLSTGEAPDRPDLLRRCLALSPASFSVLRTAALWYLGAGMPEVSLEYAERAIAAVPRPDPAIIRVACLAAAAQGDTAGLLTNATYGLELHPESDTFRGLLESLSGSDAAQETPSDLR